MYKLIKNNIYLLLLISIRVHRRLIQLSYNSTDACNNGISM